METVQFSHTKKNIIHIFRRKKGTRTMIKIQLSREDYVFDIQGLCKAFYPSRQIKIITESWKSEMDFGQITDDEILFIRIYLGDCNIEVEALSKGKKIQEKDSADAKDRKLYKNILKRCIYRVLHQISGKELPWGTLTGVRPSKLPMERLELGESREDIERYMQEQYYCSKDKISLGYEIAKKELDILKAIDYKNGYSLYIGIPFCPTRCLYCSFPSFPLEQFKKYVKDYLKALYKEIEFAGRNLWAKKLTSIYIGGGTPTTLEAAELRRLIQKIKQSFPMDHVVEFTVEAGRPDTITVEKLQVLKEEGVTRISINPQTMNQDTLNHIGRKHTVEEVVKGFELARNAGHDNINMDLIMGLPGEDIEQVKKTLEWVEKLAPESLTVHSLVVKRAARLNMQLDKEEHCMVGDTSEMMTITEKFAQKHGYEPYYMYRQKNATGSSNDSQENIGYAKPGMESIYNIIIMEEKQSILALGAGASTKIMLPEGPKKLERIENVKNVVEYINRIDEMIDRKKETIERYPFVLGK